MNGKKKRKKRKYTKPPRPPFSPQELLILKFLADNREYEYRAREILESTGVEFFWGNRLLRRLSAHGKPLGRTVESSREIYYFITDYGLLKLKREGVLEESMSRRRGKLGKRASSLKKQRFK